RSPIPPLFPYPTLFRSDLVGRGTRLVRPAPAAASTGTGLKTRQQASAFASRERESRRLRDDRRCAGVQRVRRPSPVAIAAVGNLDRKSTRLNSSHQFIS